MRRSLAWLAPALVLGACSDGTTRLFIPSPEGEGGYSTAYVGFGGQAGMPTTQPSAGAGQAGQAGSSAGSAGSVSPIAGASGQAGASACADAPSPLEMTSCEKPPVGSCAACLCQPTHCQSAWNDCADDPRCLRAARCLALGCPATDCSTLAGASQSLLLPVSLCLVSDACASVCSVAGSSAGASGSSSAGAGGASGLSGGGGSPVAGGGGAAGAAGLASAGGADGSSAGAAPVPAAGTGSAGDAGADGGSLVVAGQGGVAGGASP